MSGGADKMEEKMQVAYENEKFQWALKLAEAFIKSQGFRTEDLQICWGIQQISKKENLLKTLKKTFKKPLKKPLKNNYKTLFFI